ncbi:hypothetical protein PIB30_098387 [Stylosanthes scabra]|uniref:Uncharacterized protein n=1 Tax=Stylosanthes scabra TaxID=79078 RepID=A0ABU6WUR2_9FABA|nr:hypothetical protein [Stylosanthes scabra]
MACPHASRPHGELGHIRPNLPSSMAPPRPLLARPHGPRIRAMALVRPRVSTWCYRERSWKGHALLMLRTREPVTTRFWAPVAWGARALGTVRPRDVVCTLKPNAPHDAQKAVNGSKGEGEARHTTHSKISAIGGVTPSLPPTSPKSMLRPNKILVLAIAADEVRIHSKAWGSPQAPVVEPPKDVKGKRTARISGNDEEKEAAEEKKDPEPEDEEEEEDPEEASASLTLPSPPKGPSGAYNDPHYWDYDGDLDQWGTDVFGGEPAATQASDSAEGSEGSCSPSSTSVV